MAFEPIGGSPLSFHPTSQSLGAGDLDCNFDLEKKKGRSLL